MMILMMLKMLLYALYALNMLVLVLVHRVVGGVVVERGLGERPGRMHGTHPASLISVVELLLLVQLLVAKDAALLR